MSATEVKTPLREVRWRFFTCAAIICLSVDDLNPVKILLSMVPGMDGRYIAALACVFFLTLLYANASELVYFCVKVFFHSTLSIYFSSMEFIGLENIPQHGPVIFTGNHMNQFVDAAVIVVTCPRKVGFLVAEKSMKKAIIGDFARAVGSIGVSRPQDYAKRGPGQIRLRGLRLEGRDTALGALKPGDKIRPGRSPESYKLVVHGDEAAELVEELGEPSPLSEPQDTWMDYDILEHVDQVTSHTAHCGCYCHHTSHMTSYMTSHMTSHMT